MNWELNDDTLKSGITITGEKVSCRIPTFEERYTDDAISKICDKLTLAPEPEAKKVIYGMIADCVVLYGGEAGKELAKQLAKCIAESVHSTKA